MPISALALALAIQSVPEKKKKDAAAPPEIVTVETLPDRPKGGRVTKVTPRGNPGAWVTDDDYPVAALRENQQGVVSFVLDIDAEGNVDDCTITGSSGWPLLDSTACALLGRRARFNPARDAHENAIPAQFRSRFRWELPGPTTMMMNSWARLTRVTISPRLIVIDCTVSNFGPAPEAERPCDKLRGTLFPSLGEIAGGATVPVMVTIAETHSVEGQDLPRGFAMPVGETLFGRRAALAVGADGFIRGCTASNVRGKPVLPGYIDICAPLWTYPVLPDLQAPDRHADTEVLVVRGPAPGPKK